MIKDSFVYLIINLFTILYPIAQSFEHRLMYYKNWKYLFPAIFITGAFFIIWDVLKTYYGVWQFNPQFLTGLYIINLPIEEWLFFLTVPYACVFIYEVLIYYVKKDIFGKIAPFVFNIIAVINILVAITFFDKAYTFVVMLFNGIFILYHTLYLKPKWMGRFLLAYLVSLIPFFGVNGLLTYMPVVIYNDLENLGIRLWTIPIEDTMYSMLLFMMTVSIYEYLKSRKSKIITLTINL